jgi:glycosyltransferase involved in cell wall biosynthesis
MMNTRLKRILYGLHHYFPIADGYTIRSHYISEYLKKKYQVKLQTLVSQNWLEKIPLVREPYRRHAFRRRLIRTIENFDPQLIHVNSPWEVGLPANEIASAFGIPVIYEVRGFWEETKVTQGEIEPDSKKYKKLKEKETNVMFYADHIVAISNGIRTEIMKRGIEPEKISVVPNGIDTGKFSPISPEEQSLRLIQKYNLENAKVIGYIGSVRNLEGLGGIIRTLPQLIRIIPDLKLLIVGDGPDLPFLKQETATLNLQNYVIFAGKTDHSQIREYYSILDLFILPRIPGYVNEIVTPLKILEAMALGKTVLASDVGGINEIVENGRTGFLFKKNDLENFISKCTTLLEREPLRRKTALAAREWVEKNRDWQFVLQKYDRIYEKILGNHVKSKALPEERTANSERFSVS